MVLTLDESQAITKTDYVTMSKLMVLNMNEIPLYRGQVKFGWCIELLNLKRYSKEINNVVENLGSDKIIDGSIVYAAIEAIFSNKSLNKEDLNRYFIFTKALSDFFMLNEDLVSFGSRDNYEADLLLLGYTLDVENEDFPLDLCRDYDELIEAYYLEKLDLDSFVIQATRLVNTKY